MGSPSGTSATDGRLRKVGSLSLRSSRLTNTVVLADARSGGVPPKEGGKGKDKDIFICTHTHIHTHHISWSKEFISHRKEFHGQHKTFEMRLGARGSSLRTENYNVIMTHYNLSLLLDPL